MTSEDEFWVIVRPGDMMLIYAGSRITDFTKTSDAKNKLEKLPNAEAHLLVSTLSKLRSIDAYGFLETYLYYL